MADISGLSAREAEIAARAMEAVMATYELPRDMPDAGEGMCCMGAAVMGSQRCTCWTPVYDLEQSEPRPGEYGMRPGLCHDCAYKPGSPERSGDERYGGDGEFLDRLVETGETFFCHQGIRRVVRWEHPSGTTVDAAPGDYRPPIIGGAPYKADGSPGELCGGWTARRLKQIEREAKSPMIPATPQTAGDAALPASPVTETAPGRQTPVLPGAGGSTVEQAPGCPAGPEGSTSGPAQTSPPAPATVIHDGGRRSLTGAGRDPGASSSPLGDAPAQTSVPERTRPFPERQWRPVVGYEGLYEISNRGDVWSLHRSATHGGTKGHLLRPERQTNKGYLKVALYMHGERKKAYSHVLVMAAFAGPCPPGYQVRHLDGNPANNAWPENLAYGTPSENEQDKIRHGTQARGERGGQHKLTDEDVREIHRRYRGCESKASLSRRFRVGRTTITLILAGRTWKHIYAEFTHAEQAVTAA